MAATSSFLTFLMHSTDGTTYTKLVDVVDIPDLGGDPETLDTTTLTDRMRTNILGLQSADVMAFTANYDVDDFDSLKTIERATVTTPQYFAVWLGGTDDGVNTPTPTGALGKFSFKGSLNVRLTGMGVNEVRRMTISLAASTPIAFEKQ